MPKIGNPKTYSTEISVRGYEIDSFGHVNHAVYVQYMEHARWEVLRKEGITLELLREWKRWPVIGELTAHYLRPTYTGDRLRIESTCNAIGHTYLVIHQEIFKIPNELVFRGEVKVILIDEQGRPARTPREFAAIWTPA